MRALLTPVYMMQKSLLPKSIVCSNFPGRVFGAPMNVSSAPCSMESRNSSRALRVKKNKKSYKV